MRKQKYSPQCCRTRTLPNKLHNHTLWQIFGSIVSPTLVSWHGFLRIYRKHKCVVVLVFPHDDNWDQNHNPQTVEPICPQCVSRSRTSSNNLENVRKAKTPISLCCFPPDHTSIEADHAQTVATNAVLVFPALGCSQEILRTHGKRQPDAPACYPHEDIANKSMTHKQLQWYMMLCLQPYTDYIAS